MVLITQNQIVKQVLLLLALLLSSCSQAQWNNWRDAESVREKLSEAQSSRKIFFSQFHLYNPREKNIHESVYNNKTSEVLYIYALDFYYASGTYFSEDYKNKCRENLIEIVKKQWQENKAIPSFSWHLENPYVTSSFRNYMGCRYRYGDTSIAYPANHRFVIKEILTDQGGDNCGFGHYQGVDDKKSVYKNPRKWFDARCKEVSDIINELVDDDGKSIPFIFRLWHECEDKWMWWGREMVSKEDYKSFFIFTESLIKKYSPNAEILWGYCPDRYWKDEDDFMSRYPGDEYVDIIGFDDYHIGKTKTLEVEINKARIVSAIAQKHNKVSAIFETANKDEESENVFLSNNLSLILKDKEVSLSLVQLWSSGRFSTDAHVADRKNFLKQSSILKIR